MKFSKVTMNFAYDVVSNYAKFDKVEECYYLDIDMIPDSDLSKLAYFIYLDNPDLADEAVGADNSAYTKTMQPALLAYLKDISDRDNEIYFKTVWRDGVTNYARNTMTQLIEEMVTNYNHDHDLAA